MPDPGLWCLIVGLPVQDWRTAVLLRQQQPQLSWLQHRVAELERRQYGIAMPAACPEEERQR